MSKVTERAAAMEMIKICPSSILAVEDQDIEMQLLAVSKDPSLIKEIKPLDQTVVEAAVKADGRYLKYINSVNEDICLSAVENDGEALRYVPVVFQTEKVVNAAIRNTPKAVLNAHSPSQESLNLAVKGDPGLIYNFGRSWNTAGTLKNAVEAAAASGRNIDQYKQGWIKLPRLSPSEIMWIVEGLEVVDASRTIEFITNSIVEMKIAEEEAARLAAEEDEF